MEAEGNFIKTTLLGLNSCLNSNVCYREYIAHSCPVNRKAMNIIQGKTL